MAIVFGLNVIACTEGVGLGLRVWIGWSDCMDKGDWFINFKRGTGSLASADNLEEYGERFGGNVGAMVTLNRDSDSKLHPCDEKKKRGNV